MIFGYFVRVQCLSLYSNEVLYLWPVYMQLKVLLWHFVKFCINFLKLFHFPSKIIQKKLFSYCLNCLRKIIPIVYFQNCLEKRVYYQTIRKIEYGLWTIILPSRTKDQILAKVSDNVLQSDKFIKYELINAEPVQKAALKNWL